MSSAGFETAIPAAKRPKSYALNRAAIGIGSYWKITVVQAASSFSVMTDFVKENN
jgi:hypothetical protein